MRSEQVFWLLCALACAVLCSCEVLDTQDVIPLVCGDNLAAGAESCDGDDLVGRSCASFGYLRGVLSCTPGCAFDLSECIETPLVECGNGILEGDEVCDGQQLGSASCEEGGELSCTNSCTLDRSRCLSDVPCTDALSSACVDGNATTVNDCGDVVSIDERCSNTESCVWDGIFATCEESCTATERVGCYNNSAYRFDSCGNRGALVESCSSSDRCVETGASAVCTSDCTAGEYLVCYDNDIYRFDGCGNLAELYSNCASGTNCVMVNGAPECQSVTTCTQFAYSSCWNGDAYWFDSCGNPGTVADDCSSSEACSDTPSGAVCEAIVTCTSGAYTSCLSGDVWSYDSCNRAEYVTWDCPDTSDCVDFGGGATCQERCVANSYTACSGNAVYWHDSCGNRGSLFQSCSSSQACLSGICQDVCSESRPYRGLPATYVDSSGRGSDGETVAVQLSLELEPEGDDIYVRVCRSSGSLISDLDLYIVGDGDSLGGYTYFNGTLYAAGRCTDWARLSGTPAFREGYVLNADVQIVSPWNCGFRWDNWCRTRPSPGCGTCWDTQLSDITRTCYELE